MRLEWPKLEALQTGAGYGVTRNINVETKTEGQKQVGGGACMNSSWSEGKKSISPLIIT